MRNLNLLNYLLIISLAFFVTSSSAIGNGPTLIPTEFPSSVPSSAPTSNRFKPTRIPTEFPSSIPTLVPTLLPTSKPSSEPSSIPSLPPSPSPSSLPTSVPSGLPSSVPSGQPTAQPSAQPTSSPTSVPSSKPSSVPSGLPSSIPSGQPTAHPSAQPTSSPTSVPSSKPSSIPSGQPTAHPSAQPISSPTSVPSSKPSSVPSVLPSSIPSGQPTAHPSAQPTSSPTSVPSSKPSSVPSVLPSSIPSGQPTAHPTGQPSSQPTSQPTGLPSSQPTAHPSALPTISPTSIPTSIPTSVPSTKPTNVPTSSPTTSKPTSKPTSSPTLHPKTAAPTHPGDTNAPSFHPTSHPTLNYYDYEDLSIYKDYVSNYSSVILHSNTFVTSSFYYKKTSDLDKCSNWQDFTSNQLILQSEFQFTTASYWYKSMDFDTKSVHTLQATCQDSQILNSLSNSFTLGTEYSVACNGHTWRIFRCENQMLFCVDCKKTCTPSAICPSKNMIMNPCTTCNSYATQGAILSFTYQKAILYPTFVQNFTVIENTASSVQIKVDISIPGYVYCGAFTRNIQVSSRSSISNYGVYNVSGLDEETSLYLTFPSLLAETDYQIVCYTSSMAGNIMPFDEALSTPLLVTTACCRMIENPSSMVFLSSSKNPTKQYNFQLNYLPKVESTVILNISAVDCKNLSSTQAYSAKVTPAFFQFSAYPSSLQKSFSLSGSAGCYNFTAKSSESSVIPLVQQVTIYNLDAASSDIKIAPVAQSARLSNDGVQVYITFDLDTNKPISSQSFACNKLLNYTGIGASTCEWVNATTLRTSLASPSALYPGNNIKVLGNLITIACDSNCASYPTMNETTLILLSPLRPISPSVSLSLPATLMSCDDITLDASGTYGNGGRPWVTVLWNVSGNLPSAKLQNLTSYLNTRYLDLTSPFTINNQYLLSLSGKIPSTLSFDLTVINYLSSSSKVSKSVKFSNSSYVVPRLSLSSTSSISIYASKELSIMAQADYPSCAGNNTLPISFEWKIYKDVDLMNVSSSSSNPRVFTVPANTLAGDNTYKVIVKLSFLLGTSNAMVISATQYVNVLYSGVKAVIAGGSYAKRSLVDTFALDGSQSYDLDTNKNTGLKYVWTCSMISPTFGSSCGSSFPSTLKTWNLELTNFTVGVYNIQLVVKNNANYSDSTSLSLEVSNQDIPAISVSSSNQIKYNNNEKLVITGTITTLVTNAISVEWKSDLLNSTSLQTLALSPLTKVVSGAKKYVYQLAFPPYALNPGKTYNFQLYASYVSSNVISNANIDVKMNSPPSGGSFTISPSVGNAIVTPFSFKTSSWSDDASDLPLKYVFSYTFSDGSSPFILKARDQVSYFTSTLGLGLSALNYYVKCYVNVSDSFGSESYLTQSVQSNPVQAANASAATSLVIDATKKMLDDLKNINDVSSWSYAISNSVKTINSVNCTVPTLCSSLNRDVCSKTAKTCGSCLTGYTGISGDSNFPCNPLNEVKNIGESCSSNAACISGYCANNICVNKNKPCINDCSDHGQCLYQDFSYSIIDSCTIDNTRCRAFCKCESGYNGKDCSIDDAQFKQLVAFRQSLCSNLYIAMSFQDINEDTLGSRALTVSDILSDISMVTESALLNCTAVIKTSIDLNPSLACLDSTRDPLTKVFSDILNVYSLNASAYSLSAALQISTAVSTFSSSCQSRLTLNEQPYEAAQDQVLNSNVKTDSSTLFSSNYTSPMSDYDKFLGKQPTLLSFSADNSSDSFDQASFSIIQYPSNPMGTTSNTLPFILSSSFSNFESSRRRLSADTSGLYYDVTLTNLNPIDYLTTENITYTYTCSGLNTVNETVNFTCPQSFFVINLTCPALVSGAYSINCPVFTQSPVCKRDISIDSFVTSDTCETSFYNESMTICHCPTVTSDRRHLASTSGTTIVTLTTEVQTTSTDSYVSFGPFNLDVDFKFDRRIVTTLSVFFTFLFAGLILLLLWDKYDLAASKANKDTPVTIHNSIKGFFEQLNLIEFTLNESWKLWSYRLWKEHYWGCIVPSYPLSLPKPVEKEIHEELRSVRWVQALTKILIIVCLNTILCAAVYADNDHCQDFGDQVTCESKDSWGHVRHNLCQWDVSNNVCMYHRPDLTFAYIMTYTLIVLFFAIPINFMSEYVIGEVFSFFLSSSTNEGTIYTIAQTSHLSSQSSKLNQEKDEELGEPVSPLSRIATLSIASKNKLNIHNTGYELHDCLTRNAKLIKTVRAFVLNKQSDSLTPSEETMVLFRGHELLTELTNRQELRVFNGQNTVYSNVERYFRDLNAPISTSNYSRYSHEFTGMQSCINYLTDARKTSLTWKKSVDLIAVHEDGSKLPQDLTEYEQDQFIFKIFLIHLFPFSSYYRDMVMKLYFGSVNHLQENKATFNNAILRIAFTIIILFFFAWLFYYTYSLTDNIGHRATEMWIVVTFIVILEDVFVIQPSRIAVRWLYLNQKALADLSRIVPQLSKRFTSIMNRKNGAIRDTCSLIQYFNPACRLARTMPHLASSRFLIGLNDYDVPYLSPPKSPLKAFFHSLKISFLYFPVKVQDYFIELFQAFFFNSWVMVFYLLAIHGAWYPFILVIVMYILYAGISYYFADLKLKKRRHPERFIRPSLWNYFFPRSKNYQAEGLDDFVNVEPSIEEVHSRDLAQPLPVVLGANDKKILRNTSAYKSGNASAILPSNERDFSNIGTRESFADPGIIDPKF